MKYERAASIDGYMDWHTVANNKPAKRRASKSVRRYADRLVREEDAETEPGLYFDDAEEG